MHDCPQCEEQSVLQHGISVNSYLHELLAQHPQLPDWKLPDWKLPDWKLPEYFQNYAKQLFEALHSKNILDQYTVFHDCGKPYCLIVDDSGKHFPNHAQVSRDIYLSLAKPLSSTDRIVADLIGWDMVLHCSSAQELEEYFQQWTRADAATLFLVALAELHSNASMFGGIDSLSFKIKFKALAKRGKKLCKHFFGEVQNG